MKNAKFKIQEWECYLDADTAIYQALSYDKMLMVWRLRVGVDKLVKDSIMWPIRIVAYYEEYKVRNEIS